LWDVIKKSRTPPEYVIDKIVYIYSLMFYTMMIGHGVAQLPVHPIQICKCDTDGQYEAVHSTI